jgi:hypothetical protein
MNISIASRESINNILFSADECLDLSTDFAFSAAASIANNSPLVTSIFVDIATTNKMFVSGKAMY